MNNAVQTYLSKHYESPDVFTWSVAPDVTLRYHYAKDIYMLTDYSTKDTEMYGDVDFTTIIYGTLGECLKYINKNIRSLK